MRKLTWRAESKIENNNLDYKKKALQASMENGIDKAPKVMLAKYNTLSEGFIYCMAIIIILVGLNSSNKLLQNLHFIVAYFLQGVPEKALSLIGGL